MYHLYGANWSCSDSSTSVTSLFPKAKRFNELQGVYVDSKVLIFIRLAPSYSLDNRYFVSLYFGIIGFCMSQLDRERDVYEHLKVTQRRSEPVIPQTKSCPASSQLPYNINASVPHPLFSHVVHLIVFK